jgi:glyoxylase-like metal-dependent hydrolase (beta-lactamase superfamily II)
VSALCLQNQEAMNYGEFKFQGLKGPVIIYPISTGTVSMKTKAHTARFESFGMKLIDIIRDKEFTADLPVYCWLIQHPDGLFLIDAGYSSRIGDAAYFEKGKAIEKWFARTQVRTKVEVQDELVPQLASRGFRLSDIHSVIFTHLHVDHVGGIPAMKGLRFVVDVEEYNNNNHAFALPEWFEPQKVKFTGSGISAFTNSIPLTSGGDMHYVSTPGHSPGHCSILLKTREVDILFAGDLVYSADQLNKNTVAATNKIKATRNTYRMIETYARERPLVLLASHDEKALDHLAIRSVVPVAAK